MTDNFHSNTLKVPDITLEEDIILAGDYVSVGNISKGSRTNTSILPTAGKTVQQVLQEIFTKRLQPTIQNEPSITGFSFNLVGAQYEVGTHINSITVGDLNLNTGSYTYDTNTGVTGTAYNIIRILDGAETQISTQQSITDNNSGIGFTIGDNTTITYKGTISYSQGNIARDNLGDISEPQIRIQAGTAVSSNLAPIKGFRNYFYGALSDTTPATGANINSDLVRRLTHSGKPYSPNTFTFTVPVGATAVYIACIATKPGITKIINETALNADVTQTFTKTTNINVQGANNYASTAYNVWSYVPATPYTNQTILKVTLG